MKILKKIIILIFLGVLTSSLFFSNKVLGNTGEIISDWSSEEKDDDDEDKTIKELKQEVKDIDSEKQETEEKFDELKKQILEKDLFLKDLDEEQKQKLDELLYQYKENKEKLNKRLRVRSRGLENTWETIKELLENEKEIYKNLIPYIRVDKYEDYKEFIKENLDIINKNSNLESDSIKKWVIIKNKIKDLKEKIEEHNEIIGQDLKLTINEKIDQKLSNLVSKEKFISLDEESKINLFDKLIENIKTKRDTLEDKENKTNLLEKKIELYKIIIERLEIFKKDFTK